MVHNNWEIRPNDNLERILHNRDRTTDWLNLEIQGEIQPTKTEESHCINSVSSSVSINSRSNISGELIEVIGKI